VLPILHDRSLRADAREPFAVDGAGRYDFDAPDEAYLDNARALVEDAAEHGVRAALVTIWNNYLPGTWGAAKTDQVMSADQSAAYVDLVARTFRAYAPIFVVSGDDDFASPEACAHYRRAFSILRDVAPGCLTTLHTSPSARFPAELLDAPELDFHTFQSGHHHARQHLTWELAEAYVGREVRRPVVNAEPCYEAHGRVGGIGRWDRHEVRRATWWSLLAGASAGIGYGAHGLWSWHGPGDRFTSAAHSGDAFPWEAALEFAGAWDVGLARALVLDHGLYRSRARQDLLAEPVGPGVRAARTTDGTVVVYAPYATAVPLRSDVLAGRVTGWDLEARRRFVPRVRPGAEGPVLEQPDFPGDALFLVRD